MSIQTHLRTIGETALMAPTFTNQVEIMWQRLNDVVNEITANKQEKDYDIVEISNIMSDMAEIVRRMSVTVPTALEENLNIRRQKILKMRDLSMQLRKILIEDVTENRAIAVDSLLKPGIADLLAEWRDQRLLVEVLKTALPNNSIENIDLQSKAGSLDISRKPRVIASPFDPQDNVFRASRRLLANIKSSQPLLPPASESGKPTEGFGNAYRVVRKGALVAVKEVSVKCLVNGLIGLEEAALIQQQAVAAIAPQFLIPLLDFSVYRGVGYFSFQLAPLGSLYDLIAECAYETEYTLRPSRLSSLFAQLSVLFDVARGLEALHSISISHGRLKLTNVLMFDNYRARLADFGWQGLLTTEYRKDCFGTDSVRWLSPEAVQEHFRNLDAIKMYQSKNSYYFYKGEEKRTVEFPDGPPRPPPLIAQTQDIYALGLVVICVTTCKLQPFSNIKWDTTVEQMLLRGEVPKFPQSVAAVLTVTLEPFELCLSSTDTRPTAKAVVAAIDTELREIRYLHWVKMGQESKRMLLEVRDDVKQLEKKVSDLTVLVEKGKALIAQREAQRLKVEDGKLLNQLESSLDAARAKLAVFEEDLHNNAVDLDGAREDESALIRRRFRSLVALGMGKRFVLFDRLYVNSCNQGLLLTRYCDDSDRDEMAGLLLSSSQTKSSRYANPLQQLVESQLKTREAVRRMFDMTALFSSEPGKQIYVDDRVLDLAPPLPKKRAILLATSTQEEDKEDGDSPTAASAVIAKIADENKALLTDILVVSDAEYAKFRVEFSAENGASDPATRVPVPAPALTTPSQEPAKKAPSAPLTFSAVARSPDEVDSDEEGEKENPATAVVSVSESSSRDNGGAPVEWMQYEYDYGSEYDESVASSASMRSLPPPPASVVASRSVIGADDNDYGSEYDASTVASSSRSGFNVLSGGMKPTVVPLSATRGTTSSAPTVLSADDSVVSSSTKRPPTSVVASRSVTRGDDDDSESHSGGRSGVFPSGATASAYDFGSEDDASSIPPSEALAPLQASLTAAEVHPALLLGDDDDYGSEYDESVVSSEQSNRPITSARVR